MGVQIGRPPTSLAEKFWSRVEIGSPDDCWRWTGYVHPDGHGALRVIRGGESKNYKAHKLSLELADVEIPEGSDVHHVCENRACVNPGHLKVLSHGDHKRIHLGDTCPQGHPKTPENTYYYKGRPWHCRVCQRERNARAERGESDRVWL